DDPGLILDGEANARTVSQHLWSCGANIRRSVIDRHGFSHLFASQGEPWRVVRLIRRHDLEDITPISQFRPIDCIEVIAHSILEQVKSRFIKRAVIDRVLERISVTILRLPLKRYSAAL